MVSQATIATRSLDWIVLPVTQVTMFTPLDASAAVATTVLQAMIATTMVKRIVLPARQAIIFMTVNASVAPAPTESQAMIARKMVRWIVSLVTQAIIRTMQIIVSVAHVQVERQVKIVMMKANPTVFPASAVTLSILAVALATISSSHVRSSHFLPVPKNRSEV